MNGTTNDKEYIEMKKLLDDDELNKIVERIFPYLRATLFIRNRNIDWTIDLTNSKGYTSHEPRYIYPWGLSNILLNCYEIKSSELEYFIRAFSPYLQIRTVENSYRYISTKGNASTNTAMERWISASENSSFVKLIQQWDSKVPFQIKVPETVTVHEAFGWYLFFSLLEIPSDFMDFEKRLLQSYETQPTKGERMLYIMGKCELFPNGYRCDGIHSLLLEQNIVDLLKENNNVSAEDIKSSIISDYAQYVKEDTSNAYLRKNALESLKSQVGKEGVSSIAINSMNPEIKDILESDGWIKTLPNYRIILAKGRTLNEINIKLFELERQLQKQPDIWWNRVIEIRTKKEFPKVIKKIDDILIEKSNIITYVENENTQLKSFDDGQKNKKKPEEKGKPYDKEQTDKDNLRIYLGNSEDNNSIYWEPDGINEKPRMVSGNILHDFRLF